MTDSMETDLGDLIDVSPEEAHKAGTHIAAVTVRHPELRDDLPVVLDVLGIRALAEEHRTSNKKVL